MAAPTSSWILPNLCLVYLSFLRASENGLVVKCQQAEILLEESPQISAISGPAGGVVQLPCDVSPTQPDDNLSLVIWYKQGHETPVYSFDIRNGVVHWSDTGTIGGRAKFVVECDPAVLILEKLKAEDSGQYRCRVDFIKSPTKNSRLNVTVLLPPQRLLILTPSGEEVRNRTVGPYDEGTNVKLTCVAVGGRPTPRVSWWKSHSLLGNSESRSTISLQLNREVLGTELTCQAVIDASMLPFSVTLRVDVNLKPLWVKIQGTRRPLVAGQLTEIECQVVGARPKPSISWWKGGNRLQGARESVSSDGNISTSILSFVPNIDDSGRIISCRSVQPALPDSSREDGFKMEIQHTPIVKLELGSNLDGSSVVEGSDVYLDCRVRANPWLHHVYFTHNGVGVSGAVGVGVLVHNQSLVLQGVGRAAAGDYRCLARNRLGEGISNAVILDVKYKPQCRPDLPTIVRAARGETLQLHCRLDANPQESLTYRWWFNSSSHSRVELHPDKFFSDNSLIPSKHKNKGYILYTVNNTSSYGWIQCAGRNSVGEQREPCLFHILRADKPSGLNSCEIFNMTTTAMVLSCLAGYNGGIEQGFVLEIYDMPTGHILANVTNEIPTFVVSGLPGGCYLRANIYAFNRKGTSDVTRLHTQTLKLPLHMAEQFPVVVQLSPLLCWVSAGGGLLCVSVLVCVLVCRGRARRHGAGGRRGRDQEGDKISTVDETAITPLAYDSVDSLDKNPDLIPDEKSNDNSTNKSSAIDYNSLRPLMSQINSSDELVRNVSPAYSYSRFNYDVIPMYCNSNDCENQYIQVRPIDYRIRPQSHGNMGPRVNMGIHEQNNGVYERNLGTDGAIGLDNRPRANSQVYDDWLKSRNTPPLNAGSSILTESHIMPSRSGIYQNYPFQKAIYTSFVQRRPQLNMAAVRSMLPKDSESRLQFRRDGNVLYNNKIHEDGAIYTSSMMPLFLPRQPGFSNHPVSSANVDCATDCQTVETTQGTRT